MGLEPMKVAHSMGRPTFCEISATGRMSFWWVRAAQLPRILSREFTISRASTSTCSHAAGPAPGQSQVERVDAQGLHQVQDLDLLVERRIAHRGRLQAVA